MLTRTTNNATPHVLFYILNIEHFTAQMWCGSKSWHFLELIPQLLDLPCSALISRHLNQQHADRVMTGAEAYGNIHPALHAGEGETK